MKHKNLYISIFLCSILLLLSNCQQVEDMTPSVSRHGINSITASFYGDESSGNIFTSEIDYEKGIITVVFPYNYPRTSDNVLTMQDLMHMRIVANLDDNVTISPPLLYMDFTKENFIKVTDQKKAEKEYKVIAEIRKSNETQITNFELPSIGLDAIIDEEKKTISLISLELIGEVLASVSISHGATINPDPRKIPLDYDQDFTITVTAQDEVSKTVYTVKKEVPAKVDFGMRSGSAKVLWSKKLQVDLGISALHLTGGIAATKDYVVVNTRNQPSLYLDRRTGEVVGTVDNMSSIVGSLTNFYSTADDNDNILVCNLAPNAGTFKVWKIKDVNTDPEVFIDWNESSALAVGRKISVKGSIDNNAIITAAILGAGNQFARWQVIDGSLLSQTPEIITISGIEGSWGNNADVVATKSDDPSGDYFVSYYAAPRKFGWVDGQTNTVKAWGPEISSNWIQNAADYMIFNNAAYVVSNSINSFTWGSDDSIYLFDASSTTTFGTPIWQAPIGVYGGKDNGGENTNGTGDVALKISSDGYYMFLYFMFTNGCVVCVQFDCIDM